jgi:arsenate reductase
VEIWHNPTCSKCAGFVGSLDEARVPYRLRAYLQEPPTEVELIEVLGRLGAEPWDICRTGEPVARELGLDEWPRDRDSLHRWIAVMVRHPELIQRPIVLLDDGGAVLARTGEAVAEVRRTATRGVPGR